MTRRSLFDDAEPAARPVEAPAGNLLSRMQCVMRGAHGRGWDARAHGCQHYAWGSTPEEAMQAALALLNPTPAPRRKVVL